jgi:hypothetical protein
MAASLPALVTLISAFNSILQSPVLCLPRVARMYCVPKRAPQAPGAPVLALGVLLMSRTTMFKIPAYDPFSIVLMGAGILLAAKLALSF